VSAWPAAGAITYGQTLASSTLTGGTASVSGAFAWTTASTAPGAGTPPESATFTPTDTTDYNSAVAQVSVTVNKATPTVSAWPAAGAITYGQTLASSTLTGGTASVSGAFAWTAPTTVPALGTSSQSVIFTPTNAADYVTVTGQVSVTVNKATPTVSAWPTASAITFGQTLASSTLTGGTASVPGTFAWTAPGTAPSAGLPSESVTFTPTNTTQYSVVTGHVSVIVGCIVCEIRNGPIEFVAAPTVTSKAASSIGITGATLNGTVTANNATTQYWFAYGTSSTSLTSTTTATGGLTGTSAKSVSATLTGLRVLTTYYFHVVASNAVGTTYGAVLSFTTK
jgi:hypothetical protein